MSEKRSRPATTKSARRDGVHARFGVGVEYALHCLLYLVKTPGSRPLGSAELAAFQGVSETYLAKVFLRLKRAGIVRSTSGLKGGYELARPANSISFWDVVVAVEGDVPLFRCEQVRANCALFDRNGGSMPTPAGALTGTCAIHAAFIDAERKLKESLSAWTIGGMSSHLSTKLSGEQLAETSAWFHRALERRAS